MTVAQETLDFRRAGSSPALSLLMSAFALLIPPATLSSHLLRPTERSSTAHTYVCTRGFGGGLYPSSRRTLSPAVCLLWSLFSVFGVCIGLVGRFLPPSRHSALPLRYPHKALPQ